MSSFKQKKVHYERGIKGGKHRSRDSGVGSSSASDRASLGTSGETEESFAEVQRDILSAVQEALDAANEKIRQLEAANDSLNAELSDSNKENRKIKREKTELLEKIIRLKDELDDEKDLNERLMRDGSPRSATAAPGRRVERRTTPPKRESREIPIRPFEDDRRPPIAPQPPHNSNTPNPFTPLASRPGYGISSTAYAPPPSSVSYSSSSSSYLPPSVTYPPQPVITYPPAPSSYVSAPPRRPSDRFPNDGGYHPHPLP